MSSHDRLKRICRDCKASMRYVGTELDGAKKSYVCTNCRDLFTMIAHNF